MLLVLLGVADDFAVGQAGDPLLARDGTALTASAHVPPVPQVQRMLFQGLLLQATAVVHVEDSDVAAFQQLQRLLDLAHAVELSGSLGAKILKPGRVNEVGDQNVVDGIGEAVVLASVADFVGVERTGRVGVLHKHGQIEIRVAQHFQ